MHLSPSNTRAVGESIALGNIIAAKAGVRKTRYRAPSPPSRTGCVGKTQNTPTLLAVNLAPAWLDVIPGFAFFLVGHAPPF
jgi:hypothetical protein